MATRHWFLISCWLPLSLASTVQSHWIQTNVPGGGRVNCLAVSSKGANDTNIFAGTRAGGIFRSENNGKTWTSVNSGLPSSYTSVYALTVSDRTPLFAGTWGSIYSSTNNGTSWKMINNGLTAVRDIAVIPASKETGSTKIFVATTLGFDLWNWAVYGGGIFFTTDYGLTWTSINGGLMNKDVMALAVVGDKLFAGTDYGVHRLNANGTSWTRVGLENKSVSTLAGNDTSLFAGTLNKVDDWSLDTRYGQGIWSTTNNGMFWNNSFDKSVTNLDIHDLILVSNGTGGTNLFAGTSGGVFLSTDNGKSWTSASTGLTDTTVWSLAVAGTFLFAGSDHGVWRRPLSEMIRTDVDELHASLPVGYSLEQNYPNPFNPTTTISFRLPSRSFVSLKVFNALGREVSILLEKELPTGTYVQRWDAEGLPSGVYFCRLQAGSFTETKKLILQR